MLRSLLVVALLLAAGRADAGELLAGAAKIDITDVKGPPRGDTLYAKALVLKKDGVTAVLITVDAVAIGEIGPIPNDYLGKVRAKLSKELGIAPTSVLVNASHCHGIVCKDVDERTVEAVRLATKNLVPVTIGVGVGHEDRIMENRRLKLKDGTEVDVRRAYSLPPDEDIAEVGPIDPTIGILRLQRKDGSTLAVVYNFACHPIQGVPSGRNTADLTGFASTVIENNLSDGAIALFVQGCGGDSNPARYRDVNVPHDAEPLGNMLGLSVLKALRGIPARDAGALKLIHETLSLPRAELAERIARMEAEQLKLVRSLQATPLNLKTFLPLLVKYELAKDFPSFASHRYLHEKMLGREDLAKMDAENRRAMKTYIQNMLITEQLTRLQTNLALLKKHHQQNVDAGRKPLEVEVVGLRVGGFVLVTFPGELVVDIGLNIKKSSPHPHTFVAGYTNGYIYYAPTARQLRNVGGAQEDSDCLLAPEWQKRFEDHVALLLKKL